MNFNKKFIAIAAGVAVSAAMAVPAMALENEFHGMYKAFGYSSNFFNGATFTTGEAAAQLRNDSHSGFFAEQRARLQYIAKANDNLKLVTQFELDARFGGKDVPAGSGYLGTNTGNDAGNIDADQLTLETKNVYLDFNTLDANFKVGIQPWNDAYKSLFLLADMAGATVTKKFDPLTVSLGWFRMDDNTLTAGTPGRLTADFIAADAKFAVNKDLILGANYYNVQNDSGQTTYQLLHMLGANASMKFGPAAMDVFAAYQMGDFNEAAGRDLEGYMFGTTGKVKVANGAVNFAGFYLSGDTSTDGGDVAAFQTIGRNYTYFNPANMWLLIRNGQAVNSSTSVLGNDMTVGNRGMWGVFAGYEGKVDKLFYNANAGYAETAHSFVNQKKSLGTEVNMQVGYNIFDNLQASVAGAYLILGDALGGSAGQRIPTYSATADADNPWMANVQLSYTF